MGGGRCHRCLCSRGPRKEASTSPPCATTRAYSIYAFATEAFAAVSRASSRPSSHPRGFPTRKRYGQCGHDSRKVGHWRERSSLQAASAVACQSGGCGRRDSVWAVLVLASLCREWLVHPASPSLRSMDLHEVGMGGTPGEELAHLARTCCNYVVNLAL